MHRGAGYKSRLATAAYEKARLSAMSFAGRPLDGTDVAIVCRNTTETINHLAYRLNLSPDDVVVTTVVEHHANLLPWARLCKRRFVECDADGTFRVEAVEEALAQSPRPKLLAITGASNVTGWLPPLPEIIDASHGKGRSEYWSMRLSSPRTGASRPERTTWRGVGTRCTRRSEPASWSGRGPRSLKGTPSSRVGERSTWLISMR